MKILILCTGNSCRSQMAHGFVQSFDPRLQVFSAGTAPAERVNPRAKVLLQFHDLDPLTLRNGKWAGKRWNRRYRARKSISALNRADMLVCISEPVRDAILAFPHPRKGEVYPPALQMLKDVADMPHAFDKLSSIDWK